MKITLSAPHALTRDQLRAHAEARLAHYDGLYPNLRLRENFRWEGDTARGAYMGASGSLALEPRQVRVELDLPFLLVPFRGKVEAFIDQELKSIPAVHQ